MAGTADKRVPKTRVQAAVLRAALKDVAGIVEARNTVPVLSNVLLEVVDQRIVIMATDLDLQAVRDCASADRDGPDSKKWLDSIRNFTVCLPAGPLGAVLAELDGDAMVTITAPDEITEKWSGRVTIAAGKARFKLPALPVTDFPTIGRFDIEASFEMPCSQLADALAAVDHAISSDETRYYLLGVYLHPFDMDLRFATTDGNRLARWSMDGPTGSTSFPTPIVGRKTVTELQKLLAASIKGQKDNQGAPPEVLIEANADGNRLRFVIPAGDGSEVELIAKSIDGTFPDYSRVIPSSPDHRAVMPRTELAAAVKRVAVLAAAKTRALKFAFANDRVTIATDANELGEASEEMACDYDGPDFELGFDAKYLRDALSALGSDKVVLRFNADAAAPVRIAGWEGGAEVGQLLQVLMPVRI